MQGISVLRVTKLCIYRQACMLGSSGGSRELGTECTHLVQEKKYRIGCLDLTNAGRLLTR